MSEANRDASPFGSRAPGAAMRGLIALCRRCSPSWSGRRLAYAMRGLGLRALRRRPLDVETLGLRMRLHAYGNVAEKNLLFTPQYFDPVERALLERRLTPDFTFIDGGANVGGYALVVAAKAGPRARILAIEPHPDMFERMVFNIRQNDLPNIKAVACALADRDGEVTLFVDRRNMGETSMRIVTPDSSGERIKVPSRTLAGLLREEGFRRIDALKLDVEGAEDLVLEPFFRDAPPDLWPRLMIVEDTVSRWSIDLPRLILAQGYRLELQTRTNLIYVRDGVAGGA